MSAPETDLSETKPGLTKRIRAAASPVALGRDFVTAFDAPEGTSSQARRRAGARVAGATVATAGGLTVGIGEAVTHGTGVFNAIGAAGTAGAEALTSTPAGIAFIPTAALLSVVTLAGRHYEKDHLRAAAKGDYNQQQQLTDAARMAGEHQEAGRFLAKGAGLIGVALGAVGVGLDATLSHTHGVRVGYHDVFDSAEVFGSIGATFAAYSTLWKHRQAVDTRRGAPKAPVTLSE